MSEKKSPANSHKSSRDNIKKPGTATSSGARTVLINKSGVSSSLSGASKQADTVTSASSNQGKTLLTAPTRGRKKNERASSSKKKKKDKEVTIQDTEENRQTVINKFLESEMKIQEKSYDTIETSHSTGASDQYCEKVEGTKENKLTANRSDFISKNKFSPAQPSITLTRENGSKSDGTLHQQVLEETVHYFSTPSASKEELRPRSAPIHYDIHCLEDSGYARYMLNKLRTRSINIEPQIKNIRQVSMSGFEETSSSKQCTSSLHHIPVRQYQEHRPRRKSECCHMLSRIYSTENHQTLAIPDIFPEHCMSLHHHEQSIPDSTEKERHLISLKSEEEIKPISLKDDEDQERTISKNEHNLQKKNQRKKVDNRKRRPRTATARSRNKIGTVKQKRTSSFPLISTSSSGKTASSNYNPSFTRAYISSEEDLVKDSKSKSTTAANSGILTRGINEAWSMPVITQNFSFKLDGTTASNTDTDSSCTISSQEITGPDNFENKEWMGISKETENLRCCSTTPSQSASLGGRKSSANKRRSGSFLSQGQSLPHVSGTRSDMVSSGGDSNSTLKTSSEISLEEPTKIQDQNSLAFTGTFSATATIHSNPAAELFGYDFHVLPFSDGSSSPSPPSSRRNSYNHKERTKRPKSSMRHSRPSNIEVEDLEFPTTGAAARPKTALGSSRSVSTKQVAFEVSDCEELEPTSQNTSREHAVYQGHKERGSISTQSSASSQNNVRHRPKSNPENGAIFPKMEPYKNRLQPNPISSPAKDLFSQPKGINQKEMPPMQNEISPYPRCGYIGDARGPTGQVDALSMPSRDYIDNYSQLMVWKQERMIKDVHREIDRKYGKHVYFVHPSREFLMSIFNKSVTKKWTFFEVFHEVEEFWIKPILNWHRRLYVYSLVYPPTE